MFLITHLFAGMIAGYGLSEITRYKQAILFCMTGAVIPDLIDNPLGYIFLPQVLDSGRTFFHAIFIVVFVAALAISLWNRNGTMPALSFAVGIFLHQILDMMWHEPVTWFYPLLGPFQPFHYANYFQIFFWIEITTASEWIFLAAALLLVVLSFDTPPGIFYQYSNQMSLRVFYGLVLILLIILGGFSLSSAVSGIPCMMAPTYNSEDNVMNGILALTGCAALILAYHRHEREIQESDRHRL